jgi:hypothetical protein
MSAATEGFSAMIRALDMQKKMPPVHGGKLVDGPQMGLKAMPRSLFSG